MCWDASECRFWAACRAVTLALPSRHLGLAPAHELVSLEERIDRWAALAEQHLKLDALIPLLSAPRPTILSRPSPNPQHGHPVAVASDAAFHFRYPETGELLDRMGMPLLPWSPSQ